MEYFRNEGGVERWRANQLQTLSNSESLYFHSITWWNPNTHTFLFRYPLEQLTHTHRIRTVERYFSFHCLYTATEVISSGAESVRADVRHKVSCRRLLFLHFETRTWYVCKTWKPVSCLKRQHEVVLVLSHEWNSPGLTAVMGCNRVVQPWLIFVG